MAVKAVVETGLGERAAAAAGVTTFTLMGVLGGLAARGVEKLSPQFFTRIVAETGLDAEEIAYVGDRVDNDIEPALAAGMAAVHIRRGPWGHLHEPPAEALRVASLAELPEALGV